MQFNLLPHREAAQRRIVPRLAGTVFAAALVAMLGAYLVADRLGLRQQQQSGRNDWLHRAQSGLDAEIERSGRLQVETALLLRRAGHIDRLSAQRAGIARLLAALAARLPAGVRLTGITQQAGYFTLEGCAGSSHAVALLLQNLNDGMTAGPTPAPAQLRETRAVGAGPALAFSIRLTPATP